MNSEQKAQTRAGNSGTGKSVFFFFLIFSFLFCSCYNPFLNEWGKGKKSKPSGTTPTDTPITSVTIQVTPPAKNMAPNTKATTEETGYTPGAAAWSPDDNPFLGLTKYTVTVILTADPGYTFTGLTDAKINTHVATISNNTGPTVTLSCQFAETLDKEITGIEVTKQPAKMTYVQGEKLDLDGLEVRLTFDDNSTETVAFKDFDSYNIVTSPLAGTPLSLSHSGTKVTVEASGHSDTTDALMIISPITSVTIHVTPPAKNRTPDTKVTTAETGYTPGAAAWSPNDNPFRGLTVYTATVTLTADPGYTFTGLADAHINTRAATISDNNGASVTLSCNFAETLDKEITGIEVTKQPAKMTYTHGDQLDLNGLEVRLTFDDNSTKTVAFNEFDSYNIVTDPLAGTHLSCLSHSGTKVTVEASGHNDDTAALTVNRKPLTDPMVHFNPGTLIYTRSPIEPLSSLSVTDGSYTLVQDTDYTVAWDNNTNTGTAAELIVTGIGIYTGSVTKTFAINPKPLTDPMVDFDPGTIEHTGSPIEPLSSLIVTDGPDPLVQDTDYTVAWNNNTNIGTAAQLIVTGIGNYTSSVTKNFTITAPEHPGDVVINVTAPHNMITPIPDYDVYPGERKATITVTVSNIASSAAATGVTLTMTPVNGFTFANGSPYGTTAGTAPNITKTFTVIATYNATTPFPSGTVPFTAQITGSSISTISSHPLEIRDGQAAYTGTGVDRRIPVREVNVRAFNYYTTNVSEKELARQRHYWQIEDITLANPASTNWIPIGGVTAEILASQKPFTGSYDGDGHTLGTLSIQAANGNEDYRGMFSHIDNGTVKNLKLTVDIDQKSNTGGLVGKIHRGTIENCSVFGNVNCSGENIGGLVGKNYGSTIRNCYTTGNVIGSSGEIGGVVGYCGKAPEDEEYNDPIDTIDTIIENCYSTGTLIQGNGNAGGIVGWFKSGGQMKNSYATGEIRASGGGNAGGVIGRNEENVVENCYYAGTLVGSTGNGNSGGVVGLNNGTVRNCFAIGEVASKINVGGIVGENKGSGTVQNSIAMSWNLRTTSGHGRIIAENSGNALNNHAWDSMTQGDDPVNFGPPLINNNSVYSPTPNVNGKEGGSLTAAQIKQSSWAGWDFTNVWEWHGSNTMPSLRGVGGQQPWPSYLQ